MNSEQFRVGTTSMGTSGASCGPAGNATPTTIPSATPADVATLTTLLHETLNRQQRMADELIGLSKLITEIVQVQQGIIEWMARWG